jgi:acetoacetate decarboxylase
MLLLGLSRPALTQETQSVYTMPRLSLLYFPPPIAFRDNRIITVIFKTSPEVLQKFVPKPLLPNPNNLMFIYVGRLNIASPLVGTYDYLEMGLCVPVVFSGSPGNYPIVLYLNKALPIVGGREIYGWPKKDAEITFSENGGQITARVERFGAELLSLNAKLEKKVDPIPSQPEMPWYLLKIIPSVKKDAPPEVWQLVSTTNTGNKTKELWNCTASFKLGTSAQDAWGDIKVLEIVGAQFVVDDFDMNYGEVVHDYLARK